MTYSKIIDKLIDIINKYKIPKYNKMLIIQAMETLKIYHELTKLENKSEITDYAIKTKQQAIYFQKKYEELKGKN